MRLALVLATPAASGDARAVIELARAARRADAPVDVFAMGRGVEALAAEAAAVAALLDEGCEILACATSCAALGVELAPGVTLGSQDDHAALVRRADRVLSFT